MLNCRFMISAGDRDRISAEYLSGLYTAFMGTRIKMKGISIYVRHQDRNKAADFAVISGQLMSKKPRTDSGKRRGG